ncbi:YjjG family noncanonical pyrimidine nucleotidase [Paenibacillus aurantiacus]|uniref:YjjG family noncanonical pyrimidine nucleotidase n=1 Tax=Paenibacillus aurantiacus TaxID=1936118 RepID=A0ABV5KRW1_9BACL
MYKAIWFDLDHTLLDYDRSELACMQLTVERHGLTQYPDYSWEAFRSLFAPINWTYWTERVQRNLAIAQVLDLSFRDTLSQLGWEQELSASMTRTYWELFCGAAHVLDGAMQLIARLRGTYTLGVISNGIGEAQRGRLQASGLYDYFDRMLISDEVGLWKPDPALFALAVEASGCSKEEVLFVGDSLSDDYRGAKSGGIDFCYYNPSRAELPADCSPAFMIHSLAELPGLLEQREISA